MILFEENVWHPVEKFFAWDAIKLPSEPEILYVKYADGEERHWLNWRRGERPTHWMLRRELCYEI